MMDGCKEILGINAIKKYGDKKQVEKFEKYLSDSFLFNSNANIACPAPNCKYIIVG